MSETPMLHITKHIPRNTSTASYATDAQNARLSARPLPRSRNHFAATASTSNMPLAKHHKNNAYYTADKTILDADGPAVYVRSRTKASHLCILDRKKDVPLPWVILDVNLACASRSENNIPRIERPKPNMRTNTSARHNHESNSVSMHAFSFNLRS